MTPTHAEHVPCQGLDCYLAKSGVEVHMDVPELEASWWWTNPVTYPFVSWYRWSRAKF